jgi:hypothetical protein
MTAARFSPRAYWPASRSPSFAVAAGTTTRTSSRLEVGGPVYVAAKKRHGHVEVVLWDRILAALQAAGVELLPQGASFGAGVRWSAPNPLRRSISWLHRRPAALATQQAR